MTTALDQTVQKYFALLITYAILQKKQSQQRKSDRRKDMNDETDGRRETRDR